MATVKLIVRAGLLRAIAETLAVQTAVPATPTGLPHIPAPHNAPLHHTQAADVIPPDTTGAYVGHCVGHIL